MQAGDILISMLPGTWHVNIATLALERGLVLINEVGLDPGIDHMMAHLLIGQHRRCEVYEASHRLRFRSYCGGLPKIPNDFRYKFSWSPLGVLKAFQFPARSIRHGRVIDTTRPWDAPGNYIARLPSGEERFQAYPNRDSLPFMSAYHFDPQWPVDEFVRGTLRPNGWSEAWASIFADIETLQGEAGDKRLQAMSDQRWCTQSYAPGEQDRVVLCVGLEAGWGDRTVWHYSYVIDATGNQNGSAMARLVSLPVSLAIEAVATKRIKAGVSSAPGDPQLPGEWFTTLRASGEEIHLIGHLVAG